MSELRELYQSVILDHNKRPRNFREPDAANRSADGNNPLCGRHVVFTLEVLTVRDATDEEIEAGGPERAESSIDDALKVPI